MRYFLMLFPRDRHTAHFDPWQVQTCWFKFTAKGDVQSCCAQLSPTDPFAKLSSVSNISFGNNGDNCENEAIITSPWNISITHSWIPGLVLHLGVQRLVLHVNAQCQCGLDWRDDIKIISNLRGLPYWGLKSRQKRFTEASYASAVVWFGLAIIWHSEALFMFDFPFPCPLTQLSRIKWFMVCGSN